MGPEAAPAVPELVMLLNKGQAASAVAQALTAIGATAAVPALRAVETQHRLAATTALWRLTGDAEPAVDVVAELLDADETGVIELIAELGTPAHRLLPRMRERLAVDPGPGQYSQRQHVALARLVWQWTGDTAAVLAAVRAVMATGHATPRAEAADLAADLGDPTAVDTLRTVLAEGDTWARLLAAQALWRHTGEAEIPTLMEILASRPNQLVFRETLDTLTEIAARSAIPALRALAAQDRTLIYHDATDNVAALDEAARTAVRATITAISQ